MDAMRCDVAEFGPGTVLLDCAGAGLRIGDGLETSCPPEDFLCQIACIECGDSLGCLSEFEVDPQLCQAPTAAQECTTQVVAARTVLRARLTIVPDVSSFMPTGTAIDLVLSTSGAGP